MFTIVIGIFAGRYYHVVVIFSSMRVRYMRTVVVDIEKDESSSL